MKKLLLLISLLILTLSAPSRAQFTFPINHFSVSGFEPLDSIAGLNVVADLDATVSASTSTANEWLNLIEDPDDTSNKADWDFYLGTSSVGDGAEPSSNSLGTSAGFYGLDGGDFFMAQTVANMISVAKAHRTDRDGTWIALGFKTNTTIDTTFQAHWGNDIGAARGIGARYDSAAQLEMQQRGDTALTQPILNSTVVTGNKNFLVIFTWDGTSSSNNAKMYVNDDSVVTNSQAFNTSTTDQTTVDFFIAARDSSGSPLQIMESGVRIYSFSAGNQFLSDALAASIRSNLEDRRGITY